MNAGQRVDGALLFTFNIVVILGCASLWVLFAQRYTSSQSSPAKVYWTTLLFGIAFIIVASLISSIGRVTDPTLIDIFSAENEFDFNTGAPIVIMTIIKSTLLSLLGLFFGLYMIFRIRELVLFKSTKTARRDWNLLMGMMVFASLTFFMKSPQDNINVLQFILLVPVAWLMLLNSFRATWILYLDFKQKLICIGLSILLLVFLITGLGLTSLASPMPFLSDLFIYIQHYNYSLHIFIMLAIGLGVMFCCASLLLLLFHLPTTDDFQQTRENLESTQQRLIRQEKMASLGQLTAGIAHEIENPLNSINNFAQINTELLEELTRTSDSRIGDMQQIFDDLKINEQKINEHGRRADGIIRSMLEHSRTGRGERRPVDINRLVDEYVNLAYHGVRAREEGFTAALERDYDEAVGDVDIYPQEIGRVLINLLDNAFYAVNEKRLSLDGQYAPAVSVSTKKESDHVEVRVADNGTGIPKEIQDKIFEPFFTTKPTGQGTGLGLSLSYDIVVKGHGGDLRVKSTEEEGATFVVRLPV